MRGPAHTNGAMRLRGVLLAAGLLALALAPAGAQAFPTSIVPGARVRVRVDTPPPRRSVTGTVRAVAADTLMLAPEHDGAARTIPAGSIGKLELSRGRGVSASHILIGAVAGAAVGGVVAGSSGSCTGDDPWCKFWSKMAVLGGVGLGTVVGAGVGALIKGEKWTTLPLEQRLSIAPLPRGGATVSLRFEF